MRDKVRARTPILQRYVVGLKSNLLSPTTCPVLSSNKPHLTHMLLVLGFGDYPHPPLNNTLRVCIPPSLHTMHIHVS